MKYTITLFTFLLALCFNSALANDDLKIKKEYLSQSNIKEVIFDKDDFYAHNKDVKNKIKEAFEDYKQTKVNAALSQKDTSLLQYKVGKGKCQTLNKLREEIFMGHNLVG